MGLVKQPNGKYCDVDFYGRLEFFNCTEEDILRIYIDRAKRDMARAMENVGHYANIIKNIEYGKQCEKEGYATNEELKLMGFDKTYDELIKYIPREPIDRFYFGRDFTEYGKCPSCGNNVENCMGRADEKCRKCGQLLEW